MTDAERMEQLRTLTDPTDNSAIDSEVAEIDSLIEDYNERIVELQTKIADMDNYKAKNHNVEERELTEEILEESFVRQLENLDREDREYKELQNYGKQILTSYDIEIAELHAEIADLDRRLRKNEIAVRKNIGFRLSDEELADLTAEFESKKARLMKCLELHEEYIEELGNYELILDANKTKREIILEKQNKLAKLKEDRPNNEIDKQQLRLDQDELARLTAGVASFIARKEYIINNPLAKKMEEVNKTLFATQNEEKKEETIIPAEMDTEEKTDDTLLVPPVVPVAPIASDLEEEPDYEAAFTTPSDLDDERKAEIEETKKELLEKKKSSKVKEWLKKHKKKFIAAGLIVVMLLSAKGCSDLRNANKDKDKDKGNTSSSLGIVSEIEKDEEPDLDKEITNIVQNGGSSKPEVKPSDNSGVKDDTSSEVKQETATKPEVKPVVTPEKEDKEEVKQETEVTPEKDDKEEPEVKPDVKPETEDKKTVELGAGDVIANAGDIFKTQDELQNQSNTAADTENKIQHGDEVGKELDSGMKLEDYTEEGKAVVELPAETETKVVENNDGKTFHETLEDFFGGPISITDEANQYLNGEENTSSKTR